jgi:hypothetical protein
LVWAPAGLGLLWARGAASRGVVALAAAGIVLLAVVLGRAQEVQYYKHHYTRTLPFLQDGGPRDAYAFAHDLRDKRIGIAGSGEIFFGQYGFYGKNLDNYVQYIGVPGPQGEYRLAVSCPQFRRRVNAGDYDYLIVSQYTQDSTDSPYWYPIYAWIKSDPALEQVIEEPEITPQPDFVFRVKGELDPAGCPGRG